MARRSRAIVMVSEAALAAVAVVLLAGPAAAPPRCPELSYGLVVVDAPTRSPIAGASVATGAKEAVLALTGRDGRVCVSTSDRSERITVRADGYRASTVTAAVFRGGRETVVPLARLRTLEILALDAGHGAPIEADVTIRRRYGPVITMKATREAARFELGPRDEALEVVVSAFGFSPVCNRVDRVDRTSRLHVALQGGRRVSIEVRGSDDRPLTGVQAAWTDEPGVGACAVVAGAPLSASGWTPGQSPGRYEWSSAPPGPASLWLRATGYRTLRVGPFEPSEDVVTGLGVVRLERGQSITGVVQFASGRSAPEMLVRAIAAEDEAVELSRGLTDSDGRFALDVAANARPLLVAGRSPGPESAPIPPDTGETVVIVPDPATLEVRVVDADGGHVAGAAVRALRRTSWPPRIESVDGVADDDSGAVRLEGLAEGHWTIAARADGYAPASRRDVRARSGRTSDVVIEIEPGNWVEGRVVVGTSSEPAAGSKISARGRAEAPTVADDDGSFVLGGLGKGAQRIESEHSDLGHGWADAEPGGSPVEIRLSAWGAVEGTVRTADGTPAPGVRVEIEGGDRFGVTGEDGSYRIDRVPPGRHRVVVRDPRDRREPRWSAQDVNVPEGSAARADFGAGCDVEGQVAIDGRPVTSAAVRFVRLPGNRPSGNPADALAVATTDAQGRFEVLGLPEGRYTVAAITEGSRLYRDVTLRPGRVRVDLDVQGVVVRGTVADAASGAPVRGAEITVFDGDSSPAPLRSFVTGGDELLEVTQIARGALGAVTDVAGRFNLRVPSGRFSVEVRHRGYRRWLGQIEVGDAAGAPIEIRLEASGKLEGTVVDGRGRLAVGALVAVLCVAREVALTVVDEDGSFALEDIPPGVPCLAAARLGSEAGLESTTAGAFAALNLAPVGELRLTWASASTLVSVPTLMTPSGFVVDPLLRVSALGLAAPVLTSEGERITARWAILPSSSYLVRVEGGEPITARVAPGGITEARMAM